MAVPNKIKKLNLDRLKFVEEKADSFDTGLNAIQKDIFKELSKILFNLELDKDGRIRTTAKNLKTVTNAKHLRNRLLTKDYHKAVSKFVDNFDKVKEKNDNYFAKLPENA